MDVELPEGVKLIPLRPHEDARGTLTELYRSSVSPVQFQQFNLVQSRGNVLRGVHVHPQHADYLIVLSGTLVLGLSDIRRESSSFGSACILELTKDTNAACFIPPGVAHGFYFPGEAVYFYGLSQEWAPEEDFACRYDDANLGISWPITAALLPESWREVGSQVTKLRPSERAFSGYPGCTLNGIVLERWWSCLPCSPSWQRLRHDLNVKARST